MGQLGIGRGDDELITHLSHLMKACTCVSAMPYIYSRKSLRILVPSHGNIDMKTAPYAAICHNGIG
jgi:hypothetical protein